ncbi:hypothetical protein ABZ695_26515 [Streptomyces sp. NPDC006976]|uniref:hypothetical protein n=1 Tax=Streptomyces sp. NPDC006976 TaxID=3154311 RepID=UPI0033DB843E
MSEDGFRQVDLLGCAPRGGLLAALDQVGGRRARVGNADLALLDAKGVEMGSYFVNDVAPIAAKPSALGVGLVDVTVQLWCDQMLPGSDWMWELIRTGQLTRKGLWHSLDQQGRRAWLSVALWSSEYRRRGKSSDIAPGRVFVLDGQQVHCDSGADTSCRRWRGCAPVPCSALWRPESGRARTIDATGGGERLFRHGANHRPRPGSREDH